MSPKGRGNGRDGSPPCDGRGLFGEVAWSANLGQREGQGGSAGGEMLLVTGGAGFIGSNLVAGLNEAPLAGNEAPFAAICRYRQGRR